MLALAAEKAEGGQTNDKDSTIGEPTFCATGFERVCKKDMDQPVIVLVESRYDEQKRLEADRLALLRRDQERLPLPPRRTPVPSADPAPDKQRVIDLIRATSERYGIQPELPLAIARCESGYNANAKNRSSTASGVFQYLAGTWANTPEGKAGKSVFDVEANIEAAVRHIAKKGTSPWNASKHCWAN